MKSRIAIISVLLLLSVCAFSQTYLTQVKQDKLWGYANQRGEVIIPAQFERCYPFSEDGFAPILDVKSKQYYFINMKGERLQTDVSNYKLISIASFEVEGFHGGVAPIRVGEKWGILNSSGKVVVQPKYDDINEFNNGFTTARTGSSWVVVDANGKEVPVEASGIIDIKHFSENLAPAKVGDKIFGYVDVHGKLAIPGKFESVGYFTNRIAWAKAPGGTVGFIDASGEWVIKPQFTAGKDFDTESGLARIKSGDKWGYVNKAGEVMNVDTQLWGDFSEGLAQGRKGDLLGFYNNKGEWVIKPQFENVRDFKNGYAAAKQGGKWGMINREGSWVIKPTFEGIKDMEMVR